MIQSFKSTETGLSTPLHFTSLIAELMTTALRLITDNLR